MKKIFFVLFIIFSLIGSSYAASSSSSTKTTSNYDKAVKLIKFAKKYEKKGKVDKANKRYEKALKLLLKSNKKKPNNADILNYLGFTLRKTGNLKEAEKFYLEGLNLDAGHLGINEYLGELYVQTGRIGLAKERLQVLNGCNCEEYNELKELIEKN